MLTSRVSIGSEDISWGSRKNPFIEIPFPDDWHWIFLPSCSVSVKAVYSSFAIWNRAHGHLLISLHPTCFCVQPRLNAERSQYKWRFQSIYLSVQPRLNARDRCKSDFILSVDIFREARRGLSDKYLLRSQRVSPHYLLSQNYSILLVSAKNLWWFQGLLFSRTADILDAQVVFWLL